MIASTGISVGRSFFLALNYRCEMVIYCTRCWKENPAGSQVCQRCGAKLEADTGNYVSKLLLALSHPEPMTVQRAAWILGELRVTEAVEPLIRLLHTSQDMGSLESGVEALGKIGDEQAVDVLSQLISFSYLSVRLNAVEALRKIGGSSSLAALKKAQKDPILSVSQEASKAVKALEPAKTD